MRYWKLPTIDLYVEAWFNGVPLDSVNFGVDGSGFVIGLASLMFGLSIY